MEKRQGWPGQSGRDVREEAREIQTYLYSLTHRLAPEKKEVLISVDPIPASEKKHLAERHLHSVESDRISSNQLLIGYCGSPRFDSETPEFYLPLFSVSRQRQTFMTLAKLLEHSGSKITVPIVQRPKSRLAKLIGILGMTFMNPPLSDPYTFDEYRDEIMEHILGWSRVTRQSGISCGAYYCEQGLELPHQGFIVSDLENHAMLTQILQHDGKNPPVTEWYKVNLVLKNVTGSASDAKKGPAENIFALPLTA